MQNDFFNLTKKSRDKPMAIIKGIVYFIIVWTIMIVISGIVSCFPLIFKCMFFYPKQSIPVVITVGVVIYLLIKRKEKKRRDLDILNIPTDKFEKFSPEELDKQVQKNRRR